MTPVVQCPELEDPSNGQVTETGLEPFSTATYTCNLGYDLIGDDIRTCSEDGEWTKEEPTCQRKSVLMYHKQVCNIHAAKEL